MACKSGICKGKLKAIKSVVHVHTMKANGISEKAENLKVLRETPDENTKTYQYITFFFF